MVILYSLRGIWRDHDGLSTASAAGMVGCSTMAIQEHLCCGQVSRRLAVSYFSSFYGKLSNVSYCFVVNCSE